LRREFLYAGVVRELSDRALVEHISRLPHSRANIKQLFREFGARGEAREELEQALHRLSVRGELIEIRPGHYTAARDAREFAVGRVSMHRDGYGFLIADNPAPGVAGDIFLPARVASLAMHNDRLLVRVSRVDSAGRAEGEIVRILERANPTVVGAFRALRRGNYVEPHDSRIRQWIYIPEGLERPPRTSQVDRIGTREAEAPPAGELDGMIVTAEILEFPEGGQDASGRVVEILGAPDDFGVDVEIVIRKYRLPHRFPPDVLAQAESIPKTIPAAELERRTDFRALETVTIDGETARDFDDAVWVDRLPGGNFRLDVHIADVGHYVRPATPIDREAASRGTSVYFPDRAVPMLPLELSTDVCSLVPHVDRLVLSAVLEIDHHGDVVSQRFARGVIRSAERMTYTNLFLLLEGDAGLRDRYRDLVERFALMRELALILNRRRTRRGSIDFDLPEPLIEFDEAGMMTGIARSPRNIAHRIIEEFMLAANEAVAAHLEQAGVPAVYRIHEPPDPKRVLEFEEIAHRFGYSLGFGALPIKRFPVVDRKRDGRKVRKDIELADERLAVTSRQYQKLVARIEGKPEERILSFLMLRSLKQARYHADNTGHFALASDCYTHFTSPIRRYPDLLVHRVLARLLDGAAPPYDADRLRGLAWECSQTERRAADAERELVEWKKVKFMTQRIGDEFPALIISATRAGFFVELEELFVEGLVPLETLPGDRFVYHENARKILGERTRREFSIGDRVRVLLARVDGVERKLLFALAEPEPFTRRRKKR
jgi:ribonuclease R